MDLRNLYSNMVVFGLELLNFWIQFRIWTLRKKEKSKQTNKNQNFWTFYLFPLTYKRWRGSRGDDHEISSFLASKTYQNINFDQLKNRDINLMIIYLIQYCNFLATHVEARTWNGDFWLSLVESSRCAGNWQNWRTRFWKLKLKLNKFVDLRNLYPNVVVFGLELLIFWSWFWIWTWKYRFSNFLKILFFPLTHTVHLLACGGAG